jgi:GT2 family glycosyltransferase
MSSRAYDVQAGEPLRASLVVLNWDGREVVGPCIDSLIAAAGDDDEVIVVDNASTDGSLEELQARGDVRVVSLSENTFIFGLNYGLEVAQGRYVAFLNNDIVVEPDFVDRCVERFGDGDDVFAVCPRVLAAIGADQGSRTAGFWHRGLIFYRSLPHSVVPTDCFFAVGGQSFFRKKMLSEIGSIDPLLWPMYHEDIELSYRAWKRGWRIRYAPEAVAHHRGSHSSQKAFSPAQLRSFVRQNEYLTIWKDLTDPGLLAAHLLLIGPRLLAAALRRDWPTLVGFGRATRRLPAARVRRRSARAHMRLSDREVLRRVSGIV